MIDETPSHKHIGLTFSKTYSWDEHIVNISEKAWARVNLLKALKFRVSRKSLEKMFVHSLNIVTLSGATAHWHQRSFWMLSI